MTFSKLSDLKCEACTGKTSKLTKDEISVNLNQLDNWNVNEEREMIFKKFTFKNFIKALHFANSIGQIAEDERHHPDLSIGYGYCLVMIHTHAIKGLSINDFILASKIDIIDNN